jgi:4,5-dihydroxyphthalate decarboxylase
VLNFSLACSEYIRTKPIFDETVKPEGFRFIPIRSDPANTFWRAFHFDEFDISEMSMASFLVATSRGESRWKAIPVFPCRRFFHTWILCNIHSGIQRPEDLRGKRVGIPEYQMTAAVWSRGVLQHEFNLPPEELIWYQERLEDRIRVKIPKEIRLNRLPREKSLDRMIANDELDALLVYTPGFGINRSRVDLYNNESTTLLFPDPKSEEARYYQKTGVFPMNHTIVIKEKILKEYPWLARNVFNAFEKAKQVSYETIADLDFGSPSNLIWQRAAYQEQSKIFGPDPYPYGIAANRRSIETFVEYCFEQGLADRKVKLEELFAEQTIDL